MSKHLYVAYFTGISGSSIGMFLIGDGVIAGADAGGIKYDGTLKHAADGGLDGVVQFIVPAGTQLISGMKADAEQTINVPVRLALGFDDGKKVTRIETPAGPVNALFERLREVE